MLWIYVQYNATYDIMLLIKTAQNDSIFLMECFGMCVIFNYVLGCIGSGYLWEGRWRKGQVDGEEMGTEDNDQGGILAWHRMLSFFPIK